MMVDTLQQEHQAIIELDDLDGLWDPTSELSGELAQALRHAADDDEVKTIVLRVAGGQDFCAPRVAPPPPPPSVALRSWRRNMTAADGLYQSLTFCKKVTIIEVSGSCAGPGAALALCADFVIADSTARFWPPFSNHPEANFVLAALIMRFNRARAWALEDEPLDGPAAHRIGLVSQLVPAGELATTSRLIGRDVALLPLDGIVMSKMLLQATLDSQGVGQDFDLAPLYASVGVAGRPPERTKDEA